jgi:transcriptional regulator with XRE-family HTH domain
MTGAEKEFAASVGRLLQDVRLRAGLTQTDFAARAGWPTSKVSRLESGELRLSLFDVTRVRNALLTLDEANGGNADPNHAARFLVRLAELLTKENLP